MPANLRLPAGKYFTTQRPGNQLGAKTHTHDGHVHRCRTLYQVDFIRNPLLSAVCAVRCAEENQAGRLIQVTVQALPRADTSQLIGDPAFLQVPTKKTGLVAGNVAEDKKWLHRWILYPGLSTAAD